MSLPRYPEYKDSGVEWLGEVPAHWNVRRLQDVAQVINGYPFDSRLFCQDGGYPLIRIRDLDAVETAARYAGDFVREALVENGDVLIGMDGEFNVGRWLGSEEALLNQRMCCVRSPSSTLTTFIRHALPIPLKAINEVTYATTVKHLSSGDVKSIRIALPDPSELAQISRFLDRETARIDALIAEQETLLALLAEKRQATISHAVTRGLDPNVPMKDSGIAWLKEVPAHWEVRPLKAIVSTPITDGPHETPNFVDDGVPFVSAEAVSKGVINFEKIRACISVEDDARYAKKYRPQLHDIYMVKSGATTGVTAIVDGRTDFNIWSPLAAIRCKQEVAHPQFVLSYLRSKNFQEGVALNWSSGTQQNIGMGVLGDLQVALPPINEQKNISDLLGAQLRVLDALQGAAERALPVLRERRSALISAAVTGQIDVRGLADRDAA